uniref:Transcription elongation factor A like 3 n=2 Tax=Equus caballus TaxID=9796 RepID=A0A9L0R8H4_HORSE
MFGGELRELSPVSRKKGGCHSPLGNTMTDGHCASSHGLCTLLRAPLLPVGWRPRWTKATLSHQKGQEFFSTQIRVTLSQDRKRRGNLNMEKLCNENEGKLESEGKTQDEVEPEDEEKSDEEGKPEVEGQPGHKEKPQNEGQPDDEAQPEDKGKQDKQGQSEDEGKPQGGEGKRESQAKPESERRAAEKRPAEDYVPRKAKRKTDRGTDDSPKDYQEDLQERHLGSEEMMRECGDMSRAQEELRKKQKMGGFHWIQRDVQDPFAPRGQRGVRGVRGGGRGQRGLHDIPYL